MLTERKPHGWVVCYAFMLAFFLVMVPSLAYADTYVATEDSAVRAAMVYLGYDPEEGESTNKLVTAFYDATSGDEYTGWQSFVNGLYQPLDTVNYNEQWWSPADGFMFSAQVDRARADAAKIYAAWKRTSGGSSGGGTGGGTVGDSDEPTTGNSGNVQVLLTNTITQDTKWADGFPVNKKLQTTKVDQYNAMSGVKLYMPLSPSVTEYMGYATNGVVYISYPNAYCSVMVWSSVPAQWYHQGNDTTHSFSEVTSDIASQFGCPNSGYYYYLGSDNRGSSYVYHIVTNCSEVHINNDVVQGQPETPPEPEPDPEPEPPTPDPVPPDPDTPTPDPPRDPTPPTPDPTQPSQTIDLQGIIERLDIIIRNQAILINWLDDAFASVNANIQWLGSLFDNLTEWLSSINQNIQWLGDLIDESFGWLWEVLDNLQGSIDGGITRITTWLEMIYNRIGGQGGTVSRPNIDTPTPWDDFLSWLEGILQRLLDLIFGVTPAALQSLLSGLADLTGKFPFSIPWDLAALVALFAHAPVTPVIDFPLMVPFMNAPLPLHVDCTQWNGLASICRDGETIIFAAWLVLKTPDLYRHLSDVSGAD